MIKIDPDEFRLAWWSIYKDELPIKAADRRDKSTVALTIVGSTLSERRQIRRWCREQGKLRVFRAQTWEDSYHPRGADSEHAIEYINHEFSVLGDKTSMDLLKAWLDQLPRRSAAVLIRGLTAKELRKLVGKSHARIVPDVCQPLLHVVSVHDEHLAVELALRSD